MIKHELFEEDLQELARLAKALSHPARIQILKYVAESKTCISGDISKELPLSRTTVSQHLSELKEAGLLKGQVEGVKIKYCLCANNINRLKTVFQGFLEELEVNTTSSC
ncbi:ArsR family transcriptional regulator [Puteibacter caeruleilacunae]|nr:ArsR family transcriptional regulator [Puteibacter caeruleilacunae]